VLRAGALDLPRARPWAFAEDGRSAAVGRPSPG
jgi:hypothetical protein